MEMGKDSRVFDKLIIITNNYPLGGRTEEAFLKDEICVLAGSFQKVVVMPMNIAGNCSDISWWPTNVTLDDGLSKKYRESGKLRYLNLFRWPLLWACLRETGTIRNRVQLEYLIRTFIEGRTLSKYLAELARHSMLNVDNTVIYSFWFADNSVGLGLINKQKMPRWISRAHRYDLYNEQVPLRSRVFRNKSFRNITQVLCCSKNGEHYLSATYPIWKDKIGTLYLGTSQPARIPEYEYSKDRIRFITVARMEPVKRPLQTYSVLKSLAGRYPDKHVFWTVVGGGSLLEGLKTEVQSDNISNLSVTILGEQPNNAVRNLYETQLFDWMILLSESEGLPIAIAEAMSYGIPSIATDVGGVGEEVISGISGILLKPNLEINELMAKLTTYSNDKNCYLRLRQSAKAFWHDNLDGEKLKLILARILSYASNSTDLVPFP